MMTMAVNPQGNRPLTHGDVYSILDACGHDVVELMAALDDLFEARAPYGYPERACLDVHEIAEDYVNGQISRQNAVIAMSWAL